MLTLQNQLIVSIACIAFAAIIFTWKARRPRNRALFLVSAFAFLTVQLTILRMATATSVRELESAYRFLFLVTALGAPPWALLATLVPHRGEGGIPRGQMAFVAGIAVLGVAIATLTRSHLVFREIVLADDVPRITLGLAGKLLVVYLVAVAAYVLTQIEQILRAAFQILDRRPRLVVAFVGFAVILYIYIGTESFLYGRLDVRQLAAASLPAAVTCVVAGVASLRRSLDDMRLPFGRRVVHSSFTVFILGVMMVFLGLLSRVAEIIGVPVDRTILITTLILGATLSAMIWISPAWKRRVATFVDENFYVNRHDYRKEWERVAHELKPSVELPELVRRIAGTIGPIFGTRTLYVGMLNPTLRAYHVYDARAVLVPAFEARVDDALADLLKRRRAPLVLSDVRADLDMIPGFVAHEESLHELRVEVVVPMLSEDELVGYLMLCGTSHGAPYTPEDLSLMSVVGAHVANVVSGHLLLREVEERREGEALMKLSAFVLHDLKNSVSAVSGAVEGATRYLDKPEFRTDLIESLAATGARMSRLMERLNQFHGPRPVREAPEVCELTELMERVLTSSGVPARSDVAVSRSIEAGLVTHGDQDMLEQVFVNLVRNALEAMPKGGTLTLEGSYEETTSRVHVRVADTGHGMDPTFLAQSLFRPFATTKRGGLGIGLYQCKNIVEEHGGEIAVASRTGRGTRVDVYLPGGQVREARCETVS